MEKPNALRLADDVELNHKYCPVEVLHETAAELRRLQAENETLKKAVALLQQHHATAWNRGHTMGMKANEDTARRALDSVKQDAWGNTQLTEALLKAEEQCDALMEANEAFSKRQQWWNEKMFTLEQQRDALLEALEDLRVWRAKQSMDVTALRAALVQQEKGGGNLPPPLPAEPVAWKLWDENPEGGGDWRYYDAKDFKEGIDPMKYFDGLVPLYLAPPQCKPLTDEEIDAEWRELDGEVSPMFMRVLRKFARAIERRRAIVRAAAEIGRQMK